MTFLDEKIADEASPPDVTTAEPPTDEAATAGGAAGGGRVDEVWVPPPLVRPLIVASFTSISAALMTGGIFGSWPARLLSVVSALLGVSWAWFVVRRPTRRMAKHLALVPIMIAGAIALVAIDAPSASPLSLMGKAIHSGRVLRPPVPFDAGWRPILFLLFVTVGFAAGWAGTALRRPQAALVLPLPIMVLTAITQPAEGELLAGFLGFVPILAALAVLYGGDSGGLARL